MHETFFGAVNNFFRVISSSTALIDKVYTVYSVVDNFSPQLVVIVDNTKKQLQHKGIFDIIFVFSLFIIIYQKIVFHRLWITCG